MPTDLPPTETAARPVVVIGAGLGGTAAAAFLAHAGVPAVVLDRRAEPSARPRARMVSARSQELFRHLGLADRVSTVGEPGRYEIHVVETLSDAPTGEREPDPTAPAGPTGAALCDQDLLEGLLRDFAVANGAEFRWAHPVGGIDDDDTGVTVHIDGGEPVVARYAVLAEGARATLRTELGVDALATSDRAEFFECLFRSQQLDELMAHRPGAGFVCTSTGASVLRRDANRWTITRYGQPLEDPVTEIAATVGRPVDVDILSEGTWRPSAQLALTFRAGNVFLIGDAAHAMPPSVGMAGNLAVDDAHNLTWKLARVLTGDAGPALLDSYSAERRAVARVVLDEAMNGLHDEPATPLPTPILQLGVGYPPATSTALLSDDFEQPIVDPCSPTPRIGARLPHRWLADGRSTVDLTGGTEFVTIGDRPADADTGAAAPGGDGLVWLIRPDGYVAAHLRPEEVPAALDQLLDRSAAPAPA